MNKGLTYRFFTMPFVNRLVLFIFFEVCGIILQYPLNMYFPGIPVLAIGWIFIWSSSYTNKPDDQGFEEWRAVDHAEVEKVRDLIKQAKSTHLPWYFGKIGCLPAIVIAAGIILGFLTEEMIFVGVAFSILFIMLPLLLSGNIVIWYPVDLDNRIKVFQPLISALEANSSILVTPYLRFDKDPTGRSIPEDIRYMAEPRRKPEGFLGVQFQITINKGPNGEVPYMYAVFLFEKGCPAKDTISRARSSGYHLEPGGDDNNEFVVVRQETSGTGYHTEPADCTRLANLCIKLMEYIA